MGIPKEKEDAEESFMSKHVFKSNLLEERYINWTKTTNLLDFKERLDLIEYKREVKRLLNPVLEESNAYIRWLKCTKETRIACIKNSAVLLATGYFIFIYDLNTTKYQIFSATDFDGISYIKGSKEENIFAFAEKRNEPSIVVVSYPDLQKVFVLRDKYPGKVQDIEFGHNGLLLSLKCNYMEHRIVVWYWRCSYVVCSYLLERPHVHPEHFSASLQDYNYALVQEDYDKTLLQVWNLNVLCDNSVLIKKNTVEITLDNCIYHDIKYDSHGVLHLIDQKGNLYVYDSVSKKVNLLISWKPIYPPVDDIMEDSRTIENFLPKKRRMEIKEEEKKYVKENFQEVIQDEPKPFKYEIPKIEDADNDDEYQPKDEIYVKQKMKFKRRDSKNPCTFVWFKDGIVVSGPDGKLKYYVKDLKTERWEKMWGMIPLSPLKYLVTNQKKDRIFGWSELLGLKEIKPTGSSNEVIHCFGYSIKRIALLHPKDDFLLTLTTAQYICIWRKKSGRLMNTVKLETDMSDMAVHRNCELVALHASSEGSIYGIDMSNPRKPKVWPALKVYHKPFSWIRFLDGDWLLACCEDKVNVLLIKGNIHDGFQVFSSYEFHYEVINMVGVFGQDAVHYGVALLEKDHYGSKEEDEGYPVGNYFHTVRFPHRQVDSFYNSEHFYKSIDAGICLGHLLAVPADVKFEVHNYCIDDKVSGTWCLLNKIRVGHQIGTFSMYIYEQHYITYGFDGQIFVHESSDLLKNISPPVASLRNHHRWDEGVDQAVIDYKGRYIFSLGHDGLLICSRLKNEHYCTHPLHVAKKQDQPIRNPLSRPLLNHVRDYGGEFWEDVETRKKYEIDKVLAECRVVRIKKEFEKIKNLWNEYYEQNQKESEEGRLSENSFELDRERIHILETVISQQAVLKQEWLTCAIKENQYWIDRWKQVCWDKMFIKLYRIKPFDARFHLENFSQCLKPFSYASYQDLMKTLAHMDAAIFPLPNPRMLPWNKLDVDNVFPESKLQKDPYQEEAIEEKPCSVEQQLEEEAEEEEEEKAEEEEESDEDIGEEEEESDKSSSSICSAIRKMPRSSKEYKARIILSEPKMKVDNREIKESVKEPLNIEEFLPQDELWDKSIKMPEGSEKKPVIHPEKESISDTMEKERLEEEEEGGEGCGEEEEEENEFAEQISITELEEQMTEEVEIEEKEVKKEQIDLQYQEGKLYIQSQQQNSAEEEFKEKPLSPSFEKTPLKSAFRWSDESVEDLEKRKKTAEPELVKSNLPIEETDVVKKIEPSNPFDEPYFMTGSQAPKFIDVDFARYNEFSSNGIFMGDLQASVLKGVVEDLEEYYNGIFDDQLLKKMEDLLLIENKYGQILKNVDDITNVCNAEAPNIPPNKYNWSLGEIPEWVFQYEPSPEEFSRKLNEKFAQFIKDGKLTNREQLIEEVKELCIEKPKIQTDVSEEKDDNKETISKTNQKDTDEEKFRLHALHEMMDGVIEMSWQEIIRKGVEQPAFVNEKDPESYNEKEKIVMDNYIAAMKELDEKRKFHANLAVKDIEKLQNEIKEIVGKYDVDLLETFKKRMLIESCVQSELLKIARIKLKRLLADKYVAHINFLKSLNTDYLNKGAEINLMLKYLQRKLATFVKEAEKNEILPSKIEKDFLKKLTPLNLPKKISELLKSLMRIKPANAAEFEKNACSNELYAMVAYLNEDQKPGYLSEASESYFKSLEELDSIKNCPQNVDEEVWEWVVHSRRSVLSANLKIKIYRSYLPEMEIITYNYYRHYLTHIERIDNIQEAIKDEEELLLNHCKNMEFQLVLPDCLVETHQTGDIEDFADCVYVSKKYIDTLNQDIMDLEKLNHKKIKELDEKMKSVFDTELLHKELRLKIKIEENLLRDVKKIRKNQYVKDYLNELKETKEEPYESKDYDLIRGEKLRKIVRCYFKKYYDVLRKIKKAKNENKEVAKQNIVLHKTIDSLASENQMLENNLKVTQNEQIEKPLRDRNQSIMLNGRLSRKLFENDKEIDKLWEEYDKIQKKCIPLLKVQKNIV